MSPRVRSLLIQCHPDRNGGDHSLMEMVFEEQKKARRSKAGKTKNPNRCATCGVAVAGASQHCNIHWRGARLKPLTS